ncbi:DNA-binding transcriptional LysR family regulator [Pseudomonas sp. F-14 TE3623]
MSLVSPGKTSQCNVAESMIKASEAGMGISLIPFYTATRPLSDCTLLRLLPASRLRHPQRVRQDQRNPRYISNQYQEQEQDDQPRHCCTYGGGQ